jgi:hypothetical protein
LASPNGFKRANKHPPSSPLKKKQKTKKKTKQNFKKFKKFAFDWLLITIGQGSGILNYYYYYLDFILFKIFMFIGGDEETNMMNE